MGRCGGGEGRRGVEGAGRAMRGSEMEPPEGARTGG